VPFISGIIAFPALIPGIIYSWLILGEDYHYPRTRSKNQSSGVYSVDTWFKNGEVAAEELKKAIQKGETEWSDRITYYTQRVRGSPAFWRAKQDEVYSWINCHVEAGNRAPRYHRKGRGGRGKKLVLSMLKISITYNG
jgi:hypothetical protein